MVAAFIWTLDIEYNATFCQTNQGIKHCNTNITLGIRTAMNLITILILGIGCNEIGVCAPCNCIWLVGEPLLKRVVFLMFLTDFRIILGSEPR